MYLLGPEVKNQIISLNTEIVGVARVKKLRRSRQLAGKKYQVGYLNCIKSEDELTVGGLCSLLLWDSKPHVILLGGWSWC